MTPVTAASELVTDLIIIARISTARLTDVHARNLLSQIGRHMRALLLFPMKATGAGLNFCSDK